MTLLESPRIYDLVQRMLGANKVYSRLKMEIKNIISDIAYKNVLDVGCGTGAFKDCFGGNYYGIDINPDYIKDAITKWGNCFRVGDATSLDFSQDAFDLVFTIGVLHHLNAEQSKKMLAQMWSVCKKDGYILIIDGLIPSSYFNFIGYTLAKLDRGKFKKRAKDFKSIISRAFPEKFIISSKLYKIYPYEYMLTFIKKGESV